MPNYSTQANVTLSVNGKQAQKMLSVLQADAQKLERQLAKAASAGDKASMKRLQRELNSTNRLIQQMQGSAASAEQVLGRLDKATPKELQKALRSLQQQLNGIERGSAAWNAHVEKIKAVKAEIARLNATMATQRSAWERLNIWLNNCQTALLGIGAAITGLVMAGRKAVNAFAEMDEQLANTRKYTGMTAEDVDKLNAAFMRMDTRTPREKLNELAQEAGRLGKNTLESVQGYVEAADIINVALVDLGSGATQTIAKLTNIFGVEQMLGTKEAMLAVGSTVNVLSQNCTASKPYLVEFAQRMAGIGSQAGLTIPQILAFGAVLDANGQKVEMSATAIQKVIMNLANKNGEFARTLGLDAEQLNKTLKASARDGLMMFLNKLHEIGESAGYDNATMSLAPAFKDMGLDAARVSQVLSTLAKHIDEVKWQMGEADKAFREATSATNEYTIFNNTAQAAIDKAKKRVTELAIELGQKLYPVMKHIYTSSGIFLRVLNIIITFLVKHQKAIILSTVAIVVYTVAVKASTIATNLHYAALVLVEKAQLAWNAALAVGRGFVVGFRVAVVALTRGVASARVAFQMLTKSMAANPWGALAVAVAAATAALVGFLSQTKRGEEAQKRLASQLAKTNGEIESERDEIDKLFHKLRSAEEGTSQYRKAKDEILSKYGQYLRGLGQEVEALNDVAEAYRIITMEATNAARARGLAEANKAADDAFNDTLDEQGRSLYSGLAGASRKVRVGNGSRTEALSRNEVARWMHTLIAEATQRQFTSGTKDFLRSIGVYMDRNGSWQGLDEVADALNKISEASFDRSEEMFTNNLIFGTPANTYKDITALQVERFMIELRETLQFNYTNAKQGSSAVLPNGNYVRFENNVDIQNELSQLEVLLERLQNADEGVVVVASAPVDPNAPQGFTLPESDKDRRKRELEERRRQIKERQDFKAALNAEKGLWEQEDTINTANYAAGVISYREYLEQRQAILMRYFEAREDVFKLFGLATQGEEDEDFLELQKRKTEALLAWQRRQSQLSIDEIKREQQAVEAEAQLDFVTPSSRLYRNEEALQQRLFDIRADYLDRILQLQTLTADERMRYEQQLDDLEGKEMLRRRQVLAKRVQEWTKRYEYLSAQERYDREVEMLDAALEQNLINYKQYFEILKDLQKKYKDEILPDMAKPKSGKKAKAEADTKEHDEALTRVEQLYQKGELSKEEYEAAKDRIEDEYFKRSEARAREVGSTYTNQLLDVYDAFKSFFDKSGEDGEHWATKLGKLVGAVSGIMIGMMEQVTEYQRVCSEIELARVEKKYDREIELAEGNSYRVRQAEKAKERETARIKRESQRKMFAVQVASAVAQTATNALQAFGSAQWLPYPASLIVGALAAAMATAAGVVQIATIKKQQQLAEVQGYSQGGFTRPGAVEEVAGVVHAGEWVASQRLVNSPQARPLIEALDYAQRTNTIGSLRMANVSRSITAPMQLASQTAVPPVVVQSPPPTVVVHENPNLETIMGRLDSRLNEPFVTVATVSGDVGINRAQDEYSKLMRNKTPKSRRK